MAINPVVNKQFSYGNSASSFQITRRGLQAAIFEKLEQKAKTEPAIIALKQQLIVALKKYLKDLRDSNYQKVTDAKKTSLLNDLRLGKITTHKFAEEFDRVQFLKPENLSTKDLWPFLSDDQKIVNRQSAIRKIMNQIAEKIAGVFIDANYISREQLLIKNEKGELFQTEDPEAQPVYKFTYDYIKAIAEENFR
ncbi:MAG: hypothetical protein V4691_05830 [Pseudomonadota bacterium]